MKITQNKVNEILKISLEGKLDTTTASQLQADLSDVFINVKEVHLDFTHLVYISSAGLRVLLILEKQSKSSGIPMIISGLSQELLEIFSITGFDKILRIE